MIPAIFSKLDEQKYPTILIYTKLSTKHVLAQTLINFEVERNGAQLEKHFKLELIYHAFISFIWLLRAKNTLSFLNGF